MLHGHISIVEIFALALALSLDAFTIATVLGAAGYVGGFRPTFRVSFHFGFFQALMPIVGWWAGQTVAPLIDRWDHWVAVGLLSLVAVHMLWDHKKESGWAESIDPTRGWPLLALSIACSLDALAVGFSFSLLRQNLWIAAVIIGLVTGLMSLLGIQLGDRLSKPWKAMASRLGGILLLGIALKILLDHLHVF